jgi:hypothetical protein
MVLPIAANLCYNTTRSLSELAFAALSDSSCYLAIQGGLVMLAMPWRKKGHPAVYVLTR